MEETGCHLEHPAAATFRHHVLQGDWTKADHDLTQLHHLLDGEQDPNNMVVSPCIGLLLVAAGHKW